MRIFRSLEEAAQYSQPSVVTIGSFDGIHRAHQELLRRVQERAREENAASVVVTFSPHPLQILAPQKVPKLLTPLPLKQELLQDTGLDRLLILPFTQELSLWTAEQFVEEVLVQALRCVAVVVGENFRFGHRAAGTVATLEEIGKRHEFETEVLPSLQVRGMTVSSSQIRCLLEEGKISRANRLLGRPFRVRQRTEPGLGIGRSQTVPTLNLAQYSEMLPATGVYVTLVRIKGKSEVPEDTGTREAAGLARPLRSVTNVGYRPTFGERGLGVETHLLEPWDGPPPETFEVSFLYRLRDERKFDSPEQLKAQILRDIRRAKAYFRRLERFRAASALLH